MLPEPIPDASHRQLCVFPRSPLFLITVWFMNAANGLSSSIYRFR